MYYIKCARKRGRYTANNLNFKTREINKVFEKNLIQKELQKIKLTVYICLI